MLLDIAFCPKIADFGMAKLIGRDFSKVLTTMRGVAISAKADVYSYGMMTLEILSGRRNTRTSAIADGCYFPLWAAGRIKEDDAIRLLDPRLEGNADIEEVNRVCRVVIWCIQDDEESRPSMGEVVNILEGGFKSLHLPSAFPFPIFRLAVVPAIPSLTLLLRLIVGPPVTRRQRAPKDVGVVLVNTTSLSDEAEVPRSGGVIGAGNAVVKAVEPDACGSGGNSLVRQHALAIDVSAQRDEVRGESFAWCLTQVKGPDEINLLLNICGDLEQQAKRVDVERVGLSELLASDAKIVRQLEEKSDVEINIIGAVEARRAELYAELVSHRRTQEEHQVTLVEYESHLRSLQSRLS
ncbi:hypothetical protein ACLOJK_037683 [Asimina triloba]